MAELFYVIGASGAGKDTLLRYAREYLPDGTPVIFAHRYITRPADAGGENHVALSEGEFNRYLAQGCFAMHWLSHGLRYGIGIEIYQWLAKGLNVVVNGSRAYLAQAAYAYPELSPVLIKVDLQILAERLRRRGRESEEAIEERLLRAREFEFLSNPRLVVIENNATLEVAGDQLINLIAPQERMACS